MTFVLRQNVFKVTLPSITVRSLNEKDLTRQMLLDFLSTVADDTIGVSPAYGSKCILVTLALSTSSQVILVQFSGSKTHSRSKRKSKPNIAARTLLQDHVLCNPRLKKFAFKMDRFAASLYVDLDQRITRGLDLLSMSKGDRCSLDAFMAALGGETTLNKTNTVTLFDHDERSSAPVEDIALQAWVACRAGIQATTVPRIECDITKVSIIDTLAFSHEHLSMLAKTLRDADRLDALKPRKVKNDIRKDFSHKQGKLSVTSDRFKTKIRTSSTQRVEVHATQNGRRSIIPGRVVQVNGRAATISLKKDFRGQKIAISTVGKEDPTSAEGQRANIILMALQRTLPILINPLVRRIWLPFESAAWARPSAQAPAPLYFPHYSLNPSQVDAVEAILSDDDADRITVIQGPPGTGKTTVIAAVVTSIMSTRRSTRTLWLIAQSNVAVKNIAEKLVDVNFLQFKLLVSKDFHFDWHEHLYEQVDRNVIRSDEFPNTNVAANRLLLGSRVILCTLSMLSNDRLCRFTSVVPVETVIVDEASQIEIGDYLPILHRYQLTLQKVVFIGDDKQLAPYGQDDLGDLRSVFELPHLRDRAVFLNIQYRMPAPIGNFISEHVYGHQLSTVHSITSSFQCCRFVDVKNGKERKQNNSWVNEGEVSIVMKVARQYVAKGKDFRIITPYDAQRSLLENVLKSAKLPWEDKVFNVDSFQGNEADNIVVSLVRSDKIGFLANNRRTNVALTRCKKSMVICSSRNFLEGKASETLVGLLAQRMGRNGWLTSHQVLNGTF